MIAMSEVRIMRHRTTISAMKPAAEPASFGMSLDLSALDTVETPPDMPSVLAMTSTA